MINNRGSRGGERDGINTPQCTYLIIHEPHHTRRNKREKKKSEIDSANASGTQALKENIEIWANRKEKKIVRSKCASLVQHKY